MAPTNNYVQARKLAAGNAGHIACRPLILWLKGFGLQNFLYRAFISYSHADEQIGDWLHRALETYRVPQALVGQETPVGSAPKRLTPIFRDRNDLPAAGNLNAEIQAALAQSRFQIVICSPNSAKSRWVNEEIKLFKKLHGPDRTLAIVVAGEPSASLISGREHEECFPPALRFRVDENGDLTNEPAEPIAADARRDGDGRRNAVTKLAAGLIGVRLDDLVQREASRRARRARLFVGASATITASMALLSILAFNANNEAQRMRGEAENLIEFMLTDLRGKLEPVGRLDVLEVVGDRALSYYADQETRKLNADALGRRARALLLVGEIEQRRNDLDAALAAYEEAAAATGELLRREPNNPQRIFDHAQSVFYVGDVAKYRNELTAAEAQYQEYLRLANRLVEIDPSDGKWRLELAYATSNLGALKSAAGNYDDAIPYFEQSVSARRALLEAAPGDVKLASAYAYVLSSQADVELSRGAYEKAIQLIREQLSVYERADMDADDFRFLDTLVTAQRRLAKAYLVLGELESARQAIEVANSTVDRLIARDTHNANWNINASYVEGLQSYLSGLAGAHADEIAAADRAVSYARAVYDRDASDANGQIALGLALARRIQAGGDAPVVADSAAALAQLLAAAMEAGSGKYATLIGDASLALAHFEKQQGRGDRANDYITVAIDQLEMRDGELQTEARISLHLLYLEAGALDQARIVADALDALGVAHPAYLAAKRRLGAAAASD